MIDFFKELENLNKPYEHIKLNPENISKIKYLDKYCLNKIDNLLSFDIADNTKIELTKLKNDLIIFSEKNEKEKLEIVKRGWFSIQNIRKNEIERYLNNSDKLISTNLKDLKDIPQKVINILKKKGIEKVIDVLFYLPVRYEDRRRIKAIKELKFGEKAAVIGEVEVGGITMYGKHRATYLKMVQF